MEFRILGPLEVLSDGQAVDLGGAKQRTLLAVLLLDANNVVSNDRLIDALWEDDPPETAQKALHVYVSGLRKLLGKERVQTRSPGYLLKVGEDELDLDRFRRLQEQGELVEALALWRGPPLADFGYQRFAQHGHRQAGGSAPGMRGGADRAGHTGRRSRRARQASWRRSSLKIRCASGYGAS